MISGNSKGIPDPNFIKGLSSISSNVSRLAGFGTRIFFIRLIASSGAL